MILKAQHDFDIDLSSSILIGDKQSDIEAGEKAGVGITTLFQSGQNTVMPFAIDNSKIFIPTSDKNI